MHDYAVFRHDRSIVGRWLGIASILLSGVVFALVEKFKASLHLSGMVGITITTGAIYWVLHWIFTKYLWKCYFNQIPDLSGIWLLTGRTLNECGIVTHDWEGTLGIEQNWKEILIHLTTETSQSFSYTATLSERSGPTGGWQLSYSYKNEPELAVTHQLNSHKGFCEIVFDREKGFGKGAYFNSAGRRTFGEFTLRRE